MKVLRSTFLGLLLVVGMAQSRAQEEELEITEKDSIVKSSWIIGLGINAWTIPEMYWKGCSIFPMNGICCLIHRV